MKDEPYWRIDVGHGRQVVLERSAGIYRANYDGFLGTGATPEAALDDLIASMQSYSSTAVDLERDLAPGGRLHEKFQRLSSLVDQVVAQGPGRVIAQGPDR